MRYSMKCHSVQKKLSAYQDRELKPREQEEVSRHLLSCQSCREQYEKLERVWQTLGELEEIRPDPWFYRQLVRKIKEPREQGLLPTIERFFQLLRTPAIASILLALESWLALISEISWSDVISSRFSLTERPIHRRSFLTP